MRRWVVLLSATVLLIIVILIGHPNLTVLACSGGPQPPSLNQLIEDADYIVKARIIEKDVRDKNVILEVDKFLTGGQGPRYMLWYRVDPALTAVYVKHGYDTGCNYGGDPGFNREGHAFNAGYFALKRLDTGVYIIANPNHPNQSAIAGLPFQPTGVIVRKDTRLTDEDEKNLDFRTISSEEELETLIASLSGEEAVTPEIIPPENLEVLSNLMPLTSPLRLITSNGTHYILPVDGQEPIKDKPQPIELWSPYAYPGLLETPRYCAAAGCQLTIPDKSSFALQKNAHEISLDYAWRPPYSRETILVNGQAFTYSPDSNYMAVWNNNNLQIYLIASGTYPTPSLIVDIPLKYSASEKPEALYGNIRWSRNDSTFAYNDASGIWLVDIPHDSKPQLIIPADTTQPQVLALSETGRYLAYRTDTTAMNWILLDRLSGNEFENSIMSRSEQFIATLRQEDKPEENRVCQPPTTQTCPIVLSN